MFLRPRPIKQSRSASHRCCKSLCYEAILSIISVEKQALQHIYRLRTEHKHGIKNTSSQNEESTVHFIVGMRPAERKWSLMMASALNHKTETVFQLKFWHARGFWPTKPPPQKSLPMQLSITPTDTESLPLPSSPWPFETGTKKNSAHFILWCCSCLQWKCQDE